MKKFLFVKLVAIVIAASAVTLSVLAAGIPENNLADTEVIESGVVDTETTFVEITPQLGVEEDELSKIVDTEIVDVVVPIETYGLLSVEKVVAMNDFASINKVELEVVPQFIQGDMIVYSAEKALEEIPYRTTFLPKYRDIYYWEPSFLVDLVGREAAGKWHSEVIQPNIDNNTEPEEMYIVSFIKYFEIPKDVFEKECEDKRAYHQMLHDEYGVDITWEGYEIPNADILYTFDNEIINNYYLREQSSIELTE